MDWFDGGYQRKLDELIGGALQRHNDASDLPESEQLDFPWVVDKEPAVWEGLSMGEKPIDRNVKAHWHSSKETCPAKRALQLEIERQKKATNVRQQEKKNKEVIWGKVLANRTNNPAVDTEAVQRRLSSRKTSFAPSMTPTGIENDSMPLPYHKRLAAEQASSSAPSWLQQSRPRFQPGTSFDTNTTQPLPAWMNSK